MRISELAAGAIIGALLVAVGYELGQSNQPAATGKQQEMSAIELENIIKEYVTLEVARREKIVVDAVIERVEHLISDWPQPRTNPENEENGLPNESQRGSLEDIEKELDELLSKGMANLDNDKGLSGLKAQNTGDTDRSREPFDPEILRQFEEARKRLLEERRKLEEKKSRRDRK